MAEAAIAGVPVDVLEDPLVAEAIMTQLQTDSSSSYQENATDHDREFGTVGNGEASSDSFGSSPISIVELCRFVRERLE